MADTPISLMVGKKTGTPWRPLLEGELRRCAEAVVFEIADSLGPIRGSRASSLSDGCAGFSILFSYLALAHGRESDHVASQHYLDRAVESLATEKMSPDLFSGFCGIAWAADHVRRFLPNVEGDSEDDPNEQIDEVLTHVLRGSPWPAGFDLISGLVGVGVYALERLPRADGKEILELIVGRLAESCRSDENGISWWSSPEWLGPFVSAQYPEGHYNLGVAHGIPGIIGFLGRVCGAGVALRDARHLLDGAVAWLLNHRLPEGAGSRLPYFVGGGIEPAPARAAWCYGDPGAAAALLCAARSVGEPAWEREAVAMALCAARRPSEHSEVVDSGLCHGAAGLGHIFNRLHQATGDSRFADQASYWLKRALELRRPGEGIAGFLALEPGEDGRLEWRSAPGFLTGVTGVALALLAASSSIEPDWDRALLASIPPLISGEVRR